MFQNPYNTTFRVPQPTAPYNGEIPNGLVPGKQVRIKGHIHHNCRDFRIDFITPQNFIALHINPRFHQNQIVRNTDRGGWGAEERSGGFPFKHNHPFEFVITAEADQFKVSIDGKHAFDYRHRIPLNEITRLSVSGQIDCHSIEYVGGTPKGHEIYNPSIPSTVPIVGGLQPGKLIQILGQVPPNAGRFEIDIQSGPSIQPPEIGLHFNPRWNDPYSPQPVVIRTHRRNGGWGNEDRHHPPFPFQKGGPFEMLILCEPGEFKVAVNGQHFISYPHQFPFNLNDHIGFVGDVVINAVKQFN